MTDAAAVVPGATGREWEWSLLARLLRIINGGQHPEATLDAAASTLREGLGADSVSIWRREANAMTFYAVASPPADRAAVSLDDLPPAPAGAVHFPLRQGGIRLGLLEIVPGPVTRELPAELPAMLADILTTYLDAVTLSEDLAFEVASRSREIDEQRRFTGLIIDSLPVGMYVIDRDYRIQVWNRKRETGTQGLRRDEVVGRPVFEVLTRQPAGQLRADFDRIFRTGELVQL
jgi:PAS domain-containing protein